MAPPRVATWGGAFFRAAKIGCPSQVRPSAWGCAGRLRRSTCGLSLHMRPYCKQGACKTGTKTSQRAPLAGCSTQEIDLKERLSSAESAGPLASRKAAKRSRRLLTRRRGRKSSSPTTLVTRSRLAPAVSAPERSSVDLAGPPSNDFPPSARTRQPRPRRGDRARDRPGDDRRGARADGTGRAETASPLRPLRRPLALPLAQGTRQG